MSNQYEDTQSYKNDLIDRLANGEDIDSIEDRIHEEIDSLLPIYYNNIIEEWKNMPSEYGNRGSEELGVDINNINIYNLMSADLYLYYSDIVNEVIAEVKENFYCDHSGDFLGVTCGDCGKFLKNCCGTSDDSGNPYCPDCYSNLPVNSL